MKRLWLEVTQDEYELPLAVADTADQLAKLVGTTKNNIVSQISHYKKGRHPRSRFREVFIDEEVEGRAE